MFSRVNLHGDFKLTTDQVQHERSLGETPQRLFRRTTYLLSDNDLLDCQEACQ